MKKILVADKYAFHILEISDKWDDMNRYTPDWIESGKRYGGYTWYYTFNIKPYK
jgi:hypothetical protein